IDPAVEADLRAPIPSVPGVLAADEAPITGRPEESDAGRHNPLTRHPVVAIITVLIVARRPNVPVARTGGLIEDGDGRWRDLHRKLNSSEGVRSGEGGQHQNQKHCELVFHISDLMPLSAHGKGVFTDKELVFARPHVLSATGVRVNSFWVSATMAAGFPSVLGQQWGSVFSPMPPE